FAAEVLRGLPAAAILAGPAKPFVPLATLLAGGPMRLYPSHDLMGTSLGGVLKNVYAIGGGLVAGAALGENAAAAFLARALVEMERVWDFLGAAKATLYGLAGLGDLTLTATSPQSRNFILGRALAKGESLSDAVGGLVGESEGLRTAVRLAALAKAEGLDLPLAAVIADVIGGRLDMPGAVARLMGRPIPSPG
ncbi:glycerol-3-phosphate dehydrogenase, partial [bacterium]|nr:glycerol-3-phosphate dehydrogenase [bacterium]